MIRLELGKTLPKCVIYVVVDVVSIVHSCIPQHLYKRFIIFNYSNIRCLGYLQVISLIFYLDCLLHSQCCEPEDDGKGNRNVSLWQLCLIHIQHKWIQFMDTQVVNHLKFTPGHAGSSVRCSKIDSPPKKRAGEEIFSLHRNRT